MFTDSSGGDPRAGREGRGGPRHGSGAAGRGDVSEKAPGLPGATQAAGRGELSGGESGGVPEPIEGLLGAVRAAGRVDLTRLDAGPLAAGLGVLQQTESALAGLKARWISACQTADLPRTSGAADTTQWLKDQCRLSGREAARQARRAHRLDALPETTKALADGELSVEHADVIARAADKQRLGDPRETEQTLLDAAKAQTPDTLRRTVTKAEQAADDNSLLADENRAYGRRRASAGSRDDGMFHLHAALDPAAGAVVATALTAFSTPDEPGTPIPQRRSPRQRRADALVDVCQAALDAAEAPSCHGARPHVVVHVPLATLQARTGGSARTTTGQTISGEAARRLACDAGISRLVTAGASQILDLGRTTRDWTGPQRTAIIARDGTCRWPGCTRPPAWCRVHHVAFWEHDGPTDVDNGLLLCPHHHRRVHEGGWQLAMDPAAGHKVTVVSPSGRTRKTSMPEGFTVSTREGFDLEVADGRIPG